MENAITALKNHTYINLETFRKSGEGMKTPVWFVLDGEAIYVRTIANSGKVKRVRNNGRVNLAPCKVDGALLGDWVPAQAREVPPGGEIHARVARLLNKKYGLQAAIFSLTSLFNRKEYTVLEIHLQDQAVPAAGSEDPA